MAVSASLPPGFLRLAPRLSFAFAVFAALALAITSRPAKGLLDFDQPLYFAVAYDLDRHHVFSNGVFDDVDSTTAAPPPGMFFAPVYPFLVAAVMKLDPRFGDMVACAVEAGAGKRGLASCGNHAMPMPLLHAVFLCLGVLAIGVAAEAMFADGRLFYAAATLAALAAAAEADTFAFIMTESVWFCLYGLTMLAFVLGPKTWRKRYFLLAGLAL